jgi:uncharacterized repeat protein (TIGR03803 family)
VNRILALSVVFCLSLCLLSQASKALAQSDSAAVLTTLHTFCVEKGCVVGESSQLVQGLDGNLYGATQSGGNVNKTLCPSSCGTIYKITPAGALSIVYSFCSLANCGDGFSPASLLLASDGNFYGVTQAGGLSDDNCQRGCGTIFKLTPQGVLTTLYYFDPDNTFSPRQIIQGADGNFYGWAYQPYYEGFNIDVFQTTPQGNVSAIYSLAYGAYFMLSFQAPDGVIYGTTDPVGDEHDILTGGTVFAMTPLGALTTIHDFCPDYTDCTNGYDPTALFLAADGNFYGTMYGGGNLNNSACGVGFGCGLIFKLSPDGTANTLYTFCPGTGCWDGYPISLMQASDGNLYGLTAASPSGHTGTIFEITRSGAFTNLYNFCAQPGCADGVYPNSSLLQATNGVFYGTTIGSDEADTGGTIFSLSLGLSPFVKTLPTSAGAGKQIYILGTKLTGATQVAFNGVAAKFNVVSPTEITTTVPKGATSGIVTVATPAGTLSSNVNFLIP